MEGFFQRMRRFGFVTERRGGVIQLRLHARVLLLELALAKGLRDAETVCSRAGGGAGLTCVAQCRGGQWVTLSVHV